MAANPLEEFDLQAALGAKEPLSVQKFAIYLPDKDADESPVPNLEAWVEAGMKLLTEINKGVTRLPAAIGKYKKERRGKKTRVITENTVVLYSYLFEGAKFVERFDEIKAFIDSFGKITKQDSVMVEFLGENPDGGSYTQAFYVEDYSKAVDGLPEKIRRTYENPE